MRSPLTNSMTVLDWHRRRRWKQRPWRLVDEKKAMPTAAKLKVTELNQNGARLTVRALTERSWRHSQTVDSTCFHPSVARMEVAPVWRIETETLVEYRRTQHRDCSARKSFEGRYWAGHAILPLERIRSLARLNQTIHCSSCASWWAKEDRRYTQPKRQALHRSAHRANVEQMLTCLALSRHGPG